MHTAQLWAVIFFFATRSFAGRVLSSRPTDGVRTQTFSFDIRCTAPLFAVRALYVTGVWPGGPGHHGDSAGADPRVGDADRPGAGSVCGGKQACFVSVMQNLVNACLLRACGLPLSALPAVSGMRAFPWHRGRHIFTQSGKQACCRAGPLACLSSCKTLHRSADRTCTSRCMPQGRPGRGCSADQLQRKSIFAVVLQYSRETSCRCHADNPRRPLQSRREDQAVLERAFREKHYTGFVACYVGRVDQPVEYPKGHASEYAECVAPCRSASLRLCCAPLSRPAHRLPKGGTAEECSALLVFHARRGARR